MREALHATSGTITIATLSETGATGTFSLTFAGGTFEGSFTAGTCTPGDAGTSAGADGGTCVP